MPRVSKKSHLIDHNHCPRWNEVDLRRRVHPGEITSMFHHGEKNNNIPKVFLQYCISRALSRIDGARHRGETTLLGMWIRRARGRDAYGGKRLRIFVSITLSLSHDLSSAQLFDMLHSNLGFNRTTQRTSNHYDILLRNPWSASDAASRAFYIAMA